MCDLAGATPALDELSTVPSGGVLSRAKRRVSSWGAGARMVIWSLVHTKGGVGKTTTALFLAAAATQRGVPVRVIDADPQGSASSWADRAAHWGTPLPFEVSPGTAGGVRALTSESGELVLVDSPPGVAAAIDAAVDVADLVIIPTGPRAADIDRMWPTLDITQHRPTTILLTMVDMRKVEALEMPRALTAENAPVLQSIVRCRTEFERAFGRGLPAHLGDYADVFDALTTATWMEGAAAI